MSSKVAIDFFSQILKKISYDIYIYIDIYDLNDSLFWSDVA